MYLHIFFIVVFVNIENFLFIKLCNLCLLRNTLNKIPRVATGFRRYGGDCDGRKNQKTPIQSSVQSCWKQGVLYVSQRKSGYNSPTSKETRKWLRRGCKGFACTSHLLVSCLDTLYFMLTPFGVSLSLGQCNAVTHALAQKARLSFSFFNQMESVSFDIDAFVWANFQAAK